MGHHGAAEQRGRGGSPGNDAGHENRSTPEFGGEAALSHFLSESRRIGSWPNQGPLIPISIFPARANLPATCAGRQPVRNNAPRVSSSPPPREPPQYWKNSSWPSARRGADFLTDHREFCLRVVCTTRHQPCGDKERDLFPAKDSMRCPA